MSEKMVTITAKLPESLFKTLEALAYQRGVPADKVLQKAIQTEKYLADKEKEGAKFLIEDRDKKIKKVTFPE